MEAMMGLQEPVEFITDQQAGIWRKLRKLPGLLRTYWYLLRSFKRLPGAAGFFHQQFDTWFTQFHQRPIAEMPASKVLAGIEELDFNFLKRWTIPIINDFQVMMLHGKLLRKWSREPYPAKEIINRLLSRNINLDSLAPNRFYQELIGKVKDDAAFMERLRSGVPMHAWVENNRITLFVFIEHFILYYGDRVAGELKMETPTLRMDPENLYRYLLNYSEYKEENVQRDKDSPFEAYASSKSYRKLRLAVERRELLRMDRSRLFGMYRTLFLRAGTILTEEGILESKKDVFYLELEELKQALRDPAGINLKERVRERREKFEAYARVNPPGRIVLPSRSTRVPLFGEGKLQGEVILGKDLEGEALVYRMEGPIPDLKGKILCAARTDPGWVPLFPACKAVLIEKGSSLSHSVIVLRELGIPCIINIPGLTQRVRSGMHLKLDFEQGTISITEHE